nr:hypothetical protein [Gammaproteobacteria bacterium]
MKTTIVATLLTALSITSASAANLTANPIEINPGTLNPSWAVTDSKTMPGNSCQAYGESSAYADAIDLKHLSYALTSGDDSITTVVCPIVRDNTTNTNGVDGVEIKVFNPVAGVDFECQLNSYDEFGGLVASDTDSTDV